MGSPLLKLGYQVAYCSGCESEHSSNELTRHHLWTVGWQSARFCAYPQSVVLELDCESKVGQVQILSHEFKIASRIELFMGSEASEWSEASFNRLGYLSLDPNERTSHQARELKSVFVSCEGRFLKLVLHRCHMNCENLYNQVGLVAINVLGEPLRLQITQTVRSAEPRLAKLVVFCAQARERAAHGQQLELAARWKEREVQLRTYGVQLAQLESAKLRAVETEDYDRAKLLKHEISRVVATARAVVDDSLQQPPVVDDNDSRGRLEANRPGQQPFEHGKDDQRGKVQPTAIAMSQLQGVPNATDLPEPEPLGSSLTEQAELLVGLVGDYRARCLFSKNWLLRDAALSKLRLMLEAGELGEDAAEQLCAAAKIGIEDKIPQVYFAGVALLAECSDQHASRVALEPNVVALVNKLADNQHRVRDKAAETLESLAPRLGESYLANLLLRSLDKRKDLSHNKWRPIAARLALLKTLPPSHLPTDSVFEFLRAHDCAAHTSATVRNVTKQLVAHLAPTLPDPTSISDFIENLRPNQRDDYLHAIRAVIPDKVTDSNNHSKAITTATHSHSIGTFSPTYDLNNAQEEHEHGEGCDESSPFRDLIMKQLEEEAFSVDEAYGILRRHFDRSENQHDDALRASVLREWCAEIGSSDAQLESLADLDARDYLLRQVATWLFQ